MAQRALLALALMIGFYVLALAVAGVLLWIPYASWVYLDGVPGKIALMCVAGAGAVLWAIVPRPDRFQPPGPRLDERQCPELFRMIREVAAATGQEEPADVYLVNEVNAWVTHRGGIMGFGSRRVMGIGLPLMQGVSQQELKAIIAHEFGHYSSGDVSLGPWIYKTRAAIVRAVQSLEAGWLSIPFQLYGTMFIKLTHAVSRQQEFVADAVAAKVAGAAAAASALRQVTGVAAAHSGFMGNEVAPVLRAGFLPPIASGFDRYREQEQIARFTQRVIEEEERSDRTDPFDTHPSLKQRVEALMRSAPGTAEPSALALRPAADTPAVDLLPDADRHAADAVRTAWAQQTVEALKPLDWSAIGESVYVPQWRATAKNFQRWLSAFTPETLPKSREELISAGSGLVGFEEQVDDEGRIYRAVHVLGVGVALLLVEQGWRVDTGLARPLLLVRGGAVVDPFRSVQGLAMGEVSAEEWAAQASAAGIAGRVLGGNGTLKGGA